MLCGSSEYRAFILKLVHQSVIKMTTDANDVLLLSEGWVSANNAAEDSRTGHLWFIVDTN